MVADIYFDTYTAEEYVSGVDGRIRVRFFVGEREVAVYIIEPEHVLEVGLGTCSRNGK